MAKAIRIPRTTALFVTGLGQILRKEFGFVIVEHEHWTFEHVGKWKVCGSPGACSIHGISPENFEQALREAEKAYPDDWHAQHHSAENSFMWCYEHDKNVYIGTGQARRAGMGNPTGRPLLDIRVRLETSYWHALPQYGGTLYTVQIWIREDNGRQYKAEFGLSDDGMPFETGKELPDDPPRKIAFWRTAEEALA